MIWRQASETIFKYYIDQLCWNAIYLGFIAIRRGNSCRALGTWRGIGFDFFAVIRGILEFYSAHSLPKTVINIILTFYGFIYCM